MLTKPPVVPSKDALRLLRKLAFAGSTLAAIGVVTINYNVLRQIRLAERCLETKKQIRALSNGTGKAQLARLTEAAENGQDFSIRAMREQRVRERRFKPTNSGQLDDQISRKEEPGILGRPHDQVGKYLKRQRTTQKIRRANVCMTSTAPAHVYARPKRFTKPTASWPMVGTEDLEELETVAQSESHITTRANAEAAEEIKRATMAMTSTAPAHVYGRPKQAIPKARPNLHGAVASWLGTSLASTGISLADSNLENCSEQKNSTTLSDRELVKPIVGGQVDSSGTNATESETTYDRLTTPAASRGTLAMLQHDEEQPKFVLREGRSNKRTKDERHSQSDQEKHSTKGHDEPLIDPVVDQEADATENCTQSVMDTGLDPAKELVTETELPEVNLDDSSSSPISYDGNLLYPDSHELEVPSSEEQANLPSSLQESIVVDSQNHSKGGEHQPFQEIGPPDPQRRPTDKANDPYLASQPQHQIQLQIRIDPDKPTFMSWPHLDHLGESHFLLEDEDHDLSSKEEQMKDEEQRMSQHAQDETRFDKDHQSRQMWTPFPRASQALEIASGKRTSEQLLEPEHVAWLPYPLEESREPENFPDKLSKEGSVIKSMTAEERANLALQIQSVFASDGLLGGQVVWYAAAYSRILCNDLTTLDFLYAEFVERGVIRVSPGHHIFQTLVQWHYQRSEYSVRAAEILFPDPDLGHRFPPKSNYGSNNQPSVPDGEDRGSMRLATRFLRGLWEVKADPDWLMFNFRRITVSARLRGVKLVQEFFAVVIRYLAAIGDMGTAQAVYDEMVFYHRVDPSFLSRTLLLRGYAGISDWHRVESEIVSLHEQGISRSRPHGYALMVDAVLKEYAARTSVEQFQNFLINAVSSWGLIPTSSISMTAIQAYLSQKRYDLVREWMEILQALFPQIQMETSLFQVALGQFWQRTSATCLDIEKAIRAVAYRKPRTKLKSHFIPVIHEALSRDLASKLDAAKVKITPIMASTASPGNNENDFTKTSTLDAYLSSAHDLIVSNVSHNERAVPEIIELHRQANAVKRVNAFITGTTSSEAVSQICFPEFDTNSPSITTERTLATSTFDVAHLRDTIPTVLATEFLPETSVIFVAIMNHYRLRHNLGLPTDTVLLPWVCEKLLHTARSFDATVLLEKVYQHNFVQHLISLEAAKRGNAEGRAAPSPPGFSIQFFEFWMRLAMVTKSMLQWRRVVEEVLLRSKPVRTFPSLDATGLEKNEKNRKKKRPTLAALQITATFVLLTRVVAAQGLKGHWTRRRSTMRGKREKRGPVDEVVWLTRQLEQRRDQQMGRRQVKT